MEFYVIAEGKGDIAVLENLLKGVLGVDSSAVHAIRPSEQMDETDLHSMQPEHFGSWTLVKKECIGGEKIKAALAAFADERYLIVHLDTDMRASVGYDVHNPSTLKTTEDHDLLVMNVRSKILEWLGEDIDDSNSVLFAVAIQEMDAWVLTLWDDRVTETGSLPNAKDKLIWFLNNSPQIKKNEKKLLFQPGKVKEEYNQRSWGFRKPKNLNRVRARNRSLDLFVSQLEGLQVEDPTE